MVVQIMQSAWLQAAAATPVALFTIALGQGPVAKFKGAHLFFSHLLSLLSLHSWRGALVAMMI
jgi:hypothetical protein